jgi:Transglutaminase-like enzymes, putative cysteine proteases
MKTKNTSSGALPGSAVWHDLSLPGYTPPEVPSWAREKGPEWMERFRGINGLSAAWQRCFDGPNAPGTAGIDRYQANHFIPFRPETARYLQEEYTPLEVRYVPGTYPELEEIAAAAVRSRTDVEAKAEALLMGPGRALKHPYIPPLGPVISPSRNLDELALLRSGCAWCNEQARVFVRLCQTQNIPARLIHLFYSTPPIGHTIAEFHNGRSWCLVDASYFIVFRTEDGTTLSAADCHDRGAGQRRYSELAAAAIRRLVKEGEKCPPEERDPRLENFLAERRPVTEEFCFAQLESFGVINYPLPGKNGET